MKGKINMELGKKIKQLRAKAKLTQEELAEKIGVLAQSVSKWENSVSMPDITLLPKIAEVFGVSIDDLFDLSVEQRLSRIENRMDVEEDLPWDVFREYEEFLKSQISDEKHKKRATELTAYLYWHKMNACAQKVRRYAKDAIRLDPTEKKCQWMLNMAENHYIWDWNLSNHSKAVEFYREIVETSPKSRLPYFYLIDNLLADNRADEAEEYLNRFCDLEDSSPIMAKVYRAYIALARFDEAEADNIISELIAEKSDDSACLFEAAQYYARKCDYKKAIEFYERSFENDTEKPRFQDALQGIAEIYEIMGEYGKAAETYDRIVTLLKDEWNLTEETELQFAKAEKARLLAKQKSAVDKQKQNRQTS